MPPSIQFFAQAAALTPNHWSMPDTITSHFSREGHKDYFLNTIISYVKSLYDILHLWRIRVIDGAVADLSSISMDYLYPLSLLQQAILSNIMGALAARRDFEQQGGHSSSIDWQKYRVLLGKPGTGKSQVTDSGHPSCHRN